MKNLVFIVFFAISFNLFSQNELFVIKKGGTFLRDNNKLTFRSVNAILKDYKGKLVARGEGDIKFPPDVIIVNKHYYKLFLTGEELIEKYLKKNISSFDTVVDGYHYHWEDAKFLSSDGKTDTNYKLRINKIKKKTYILSGSDEN